MTFPKTTDLRRFCESNGIETPKGLLNGYKLQFGGKFYRIKQLPNGYLKLKELPKHDLTTIAL